MNLISQNLFFIFTGLTAVAFGILAWLVWDLTRKVKILFGGGEEPRDFQRDLVRRLTWSKAKLEEMEPRVAALEKVARVSVQKVGFLRFNPFQDTGGDQSFTMVLLDRENNGIILSSLYTREGIRMYAKNVERGRSKYPLSGEEEKVLEETINK